MRDCANCFHRKPVLKEDGTWTAECEKWDCEFQSRENMIEKTEAKQGDLISRSALIKEINENKELFEKERVYLEGLLLNAPTVETEIPQVVLFAENITEKEKQKLIAEFKAVMDNAVFTVEPERPKGEWIVLVDADNIQTCKCSICGRIADIANREFDKFPYCHCGAKMKGGAE